MLSEDDRSVVPVSHFIVKYSYWININRSIYRSILQSIDQPNRSFHRLNRSIIKSIISNITEIHYRINRSIIESINRSFNQSSNQHWINRSINNCRRKDVGPKVPEMDPTTEGRIALFMKQLLLSLDALHKENIAYLDLRVSKKSIIDN